MNRMDKNNNLKGFTLVELLVVISIIALLLAILMPSLQRARSQAQEVVCRSNLKQLNMTLSMYMIDHDNKGMVSEGGANFWPFQLAPYFGDKGYETNPAENVEGIMQVLHCASTKEPILPAPESDVGTAKNDYRHGNPAWSDNPNIDQFYVEGSYGINAWIGGWVLERVIRPDMIPSRTFRNKMSGRSDIPTFADSIWVGVWPMSYELDIMMSNQFHGVDRGGWYGLQRSCIARHRNGINLGFLDGHVGYTELNDLWNWRWHAKWEKVRNAKLPSARK